MLKPFYYGNEHINIKYMQQKDVLILFIIEWIVNELIYVDER